MFISASTISPLPLSASRRTADRQELPLPRRLRPGPRPLPAVLTLVEADGPQRLDIVDETGKPLCAQILAPGRLEGVLLPPDAAGLVLNGTGAGAARLGYYPLEHWRLLLAALRQRTPGGFKGANRVARLMRRELKRVIWASPAAALMGLPAYKRFRQQHVGTFAPAAPADGATTVHFASGAATISLERLAACAAALARQTDRQFRWRVGVPEARLAREGAALKAAVGPHGELVATAGVSEAEALAAALAGIGEGLAVPLDADGTPTRDAVALIRAAVADHPDCDFLYTDEEGLDRFGQPEAPVFKPAFNRHLLQAMDYVGSLRVMRAERLRAFPLRPEFGGAALYDLTLRYLDGLPPAAIRHVPRVAWSGPARAPGFADEATARLAAGALSQRLSVPVETSANGRHLRPLYPLPEPAPLVSIIIPTRDRAGLLGTTLRTLIAATAYRPFELVIVDNGSVEPATFALFEEAARLWPATRIVRDDGDFNFSRLCNAGIAASRGDLLLLLNNDMEIVEPSWLGEMVALASLPATGIVGAKLLYPDRSLQHAGFIIGLRSGAGSHWFPHAGADAPGYRERLLVRQNLSAVTGACLMIRRDCLDAAGPLDEARFAEECNDVDLCLRARRAGFEVVFTPFARLIHHESASRGHATGKERPNRLAERARFEELWEMPTRTDPHFSPNLERDNEYALNAPAPRGSLAPRTDAI
ncbi:glycosyltransferase [Ancylobacter sp. G4_0304]|uniref:glycosyltransferase n=1 Tax=Ancylobacter sp. G4_0304 TaxID=3114289 RepID=UPI0039C66101